MIMKSEWERIEMNGNVIGCDIGVGFDTISAIQHWNENKWMNESLSIIQINTISTNKYGLCRFLLIQFD